MATRSAGGPAAAAGGAAAGNTTAASNASGINGNNTLMRSAATFTADSPPGGGGGGAGAGGNVTMMEGSTVPPVDSTPPSVDLLTYYRKRIEEFEAEQQLWLGELEKVQVTHEEMHRLRWELKVREEEVHELQKALSDANVYLYDEREHVIKLQAENDHLKIQELEDRRRIQHLLALTQPVTQEVTFFRDCRPEKVTRYPTADAGSASAVPPPPVPAGGGGAPGGGPSGGGGAGTGPGGRILRTVYLPSERADALLATVQSLQQQLNETNKLMEDRTRAWEEDRRTRDEIAQRRIEDDAVKIAGLEKELATVRNRLRATTKDYLACRFNAQQTTRLIREELALVKAANNKLQHEGQQVRQQATVEVKISRQQVAAETQAMAAHTRLLSRQREDDLLVLKEQYAQVQAMYESRVKALEAKQAALRAKYHALERRRNLELEGYTRDITALRKTVTMLETHTAAMLMTAAAAGVDVTGAGPAGGDMKRGRGGRPTTAAGPAGGEPPVPPFRPTNIGQYSLTHLEAAEEGVPTAAAEQLESMMGELQGRLSALTSTARGH